MNENKPDTPDDGEIAPAVPLDDETVRKSYDEAKEYIAKTPRRISYTSVSMLLLHVSIALWCFSGEYPYNLIGIFVNAIFAGMRAVDIYRRWNDVTKNTIVAHSFIGLFDAVNVPNYAFDQETNTMTFNFIVPVIFAGRKIRNK